jgi:hypothetical protein
MFNLTKNEVKRGRFAPCAVSRQLLQPLPAAVGRMLAQKVLLSSRGLEKRLILNHLHRCSFKHKQMNTNILKRHEVLRGKTSGRETQQPNLTTKGRNQRQINE